MQWETPGVTDTGRLGAWEVVFIFCMHLTHSQTLKPGVCGAPCWGRLIGPLPWSGSRLPWGSSRGLAGKWETHSHGQDPGGAARRDFSRVVTGEEKAVPAAWGADRQSCRRGDVEPGLEGYVGGCVSGDREEGHSRRGTVWAKSPTLRTFCPTPCVTVFPSLSLQ